MSMLSSPWVRRGRCTVLSATALTLVLASPALAEPGEPTPSPSGSASSSPAAGTDPTSAGSPTSSTGTSSDPWAYDGPDAAGDQPLSATDVDAQVEEARRLADELLADDREIAAAVSELRRYSKQANDQLQAYATARDDLREAEAEAKSAEEALDRLKDRLSKGRQDLRDWASSTYTRAGGYSDALVLADSLGEDPSEMSSSVSDLSYLTDDRMHGVSLLREDTETQASLTASKEKAEKTAARAEKRAATAKGKADDAVSERKDRLDELREEHAEQLEDAGPVAQALLGVADDGAQDAQEALTDAMAESGEDVSDLEGLEPCSDNEEVYPNGQIPPGGLCALTTASGESLRPEAAAAFDAMSTAYERDTGSPLCVTDSYRSYPEQVVLKEQKGRWAATPGQSNHGFGLAVDLCGGVNTFGHPAHLWMQQNAPLYGWFHPEWAAAGGSLPEPWHWEFAG